MFRGIDDIYAALQGPIENPTTLTPLGALLARAPPIAMLVATALSGIEGSLEHQIQLLEKRAKHEEVTHTYK